MNAGISVISTGVVYRNEHPHLRSRHAYFPSLVMAEDGELLISFAIGEAFEAANLDTYLSRSVDGGLSWSEPVLLLNEPVMEVSRFARLTYFGKGQTIAIIDRCSRSEHPQEGLANPQNLGFVPVTLWIARSSDFGRTWQPAQQIIPPLIGPSFELCSPIVSLSDGSWIWPTSTWRDWQGNEPNGMKMIALVSHDNGTTWPEYWTIMDRHHDKIIFWESKVVELASGTLLSVAWCYDEKTGKDLDIHYTISNDYGRSWSLPAGTGLSGQTVACIRIDENRLLIVYRRTDQPGLWANISEVKKGTWVNLQSHPLWGAGNQSLFNSGDIVQVFNELKFGAPSIIQSGPGEYMVVFWCYENLVSNIRWIKVLIR